MKKILNFKYLAILVVIFLVSSCTKDDFTGHSKLVPTSPSISVEGINPEGFTLVEGGQSYEFTVNLSEAQIADIILNVAKVGGDATEGADYTADHSVTIPAGATSGKIKVDVLSDDLFEETETLSLQIGDNTTSNASFDPVTVNFTIENRTGNELSMEMSWATDALDAIGLDLEPTTAVDMRLLIIHSGPDTVYAVEDGGDFENFTFTDSDPDGTYLIATDIFSTVNAGDFNSPLTLDMTLSFDQVGKINGTTLSYPAVMTNEFVCEGYRTYLASIQKTGGDYEIEKNQYLEIAPVEVTYGQFSGSDGHVLSGGVPSKFASHIELLDGNIIKGINQEWISLFWGEEIVTEGDVVFTVADDGTFTIADQYLFTTLYDGAEYPYNITGSGVYADCGPYPTLTFTYTLSQDGFDPSAWALENGYMNTAYFTAKVSLDPAYQGLVSNSNNGNTLSFEKISKSQKPSR